MKEQTKELIDALTQKELTEVAEYITAKLIAQVADYLRKNPDMAEVKS